MGAEIAKLSLWLAAFVPGLSLAYLDRNIQVGNALVGVADVSSLRPPTADPGQIWFLEEQLPEALSRAAAAAARVASGDDRTPDEIRTSEQADEEARAATKNLERVLHMWTAATFGPKKLRGAKERVEFAGTAILDGQTDEMIEMAERIAAKQRFLHWRPAFPLVFDRDNP